MTRFTRSHPMLACAVFALAAVGVAWAVGVASVRAAASSAVPSDPGRTAVAGPVTVTLEESAAAVPVGGSFGYTARVRATRPVDYLQVRTRLFHPTGSLIYQKTFVEQDLKRGTRTFAFERGIGDIGLEPGTYPLELSVRVSASGETTDAVVSTALLVYDPEGPPTPVALIARVSARPLADPDGRFESDPAQFTRARDDVSTLARLVVLDPDLRLTLSLSPVMLEEWQRIAGGYRLESAEGEVEVAADDATPRAYGAALDTLRRATMTGRLEVLSLGYSDPSLSELRAARLDEDVAPQYERGAAVLASALASDASSGTAPAGGGVPETLLKRLEGQDIGFAVVRDSRARFGATRAEPGAYRSRGSSIRLLVSSDRAARALIASTTADVVRTAFDHRDGQARTRPFPVMVTVGPGAATAERVVDVARALDAEPWISLQTATSAVGNSGGARVKLTGRPADPDAPPDYWPTVRSARDSAGALAFALGAAEAETAQAERNSLISQGSAWSGFDGRWAPAGRGLAFAASAQRVASSVLGTLRMSAKPVTLAGASGEVPVTVSNTGDTVLRAVLVAEAGPSVTISGTGRQVVTLRPGDTFTEVPVRLNNALVGDLRLSLRADALEIADETVRLRASYLDRLAVIAGIVAGLGALLVFIITRVRAAEASALDAEQNRRR